MEKTASKTLNTTIWYALNAIKRHKMLSQKKILKAVGDSPDIALKYAKRMGQINGAETPEVESVIAKDPRCAYDYSRDILKNRFKLGEPTLAKDPELAYRYALNILVPLGIHRFELAEPILAENPVFACLYTYKVLNPNPWRKIGCPRFELAEPNIAQHPECAYSYAVNVLKHAGFKRWEEAEHTLANPELETDEKFTFFYAQELLEPSGITRWEEAEKVFAKYPYEACWYALRMLGGPFPLGEKAISSDEDDKAEYLKFLKQNSMSPAYPSLFDNKPKKEATSKQGGLREVFIMDPHGHLINTDGVQHGTWALNYLRRQDPDTWLEGEQEDAIQTLLDEGWARLGITGRLAFLDKVGSFTQNDLEALQEILGHHDNVDKVLIEVSKPGNFERPASVDFEVSEFLAINRAAEVSRMLNTGKSLVGSQSSELTLEPGNHTFKLEGATLQYQVRHHHIEIASLRVPRPQRRTGKAKQIMLEFLKFCDVNDKDVQLLASPLDSKTSLARLVSFYETLGFEIVGPGNLAQEPLMRRKSHKTAHQKQASLEDEIEALTDRYREVVLKLRKSVPKHEWEDEGLDDSYAYPPDFDDLEELQAKHPELANLLAIEEFQESGGYLVPTFGNAGYGEADIACISGLGDCDMRELLEEEKGEEWVAALEDPDNDNGLGVEESDFPGITKYLQNPASLKADIEKAKADIAREWMEEIENTIAVLENKDFPEHSEESLEAAAERLGLPEDSETVRLFVSGDIDEEEALRRADIISARHDETPYDKLLAQGYTREEARDAIQDQMGEILDKDKKSSASKTAKPISLPAKAVQQVKDIVMEVLKNPPPSSYLMNTPSVTKEGPAESVEWVNPKGDLVCEAGPLEIIVQYRERGSNGIRGKGWKYVLQASTREGSVLRPPVIHFIIDDRWLTEPVDVWGGVQEELASVAAHELTHLFDPQMGEMNTDYATYMKNRKVYVNAPNEIRAHLQQMAREIRTVVRNNRERVSFKEALEGVITWRSLEEHLTEDNRKKVLKALAPIYQEVREEIDAWRQQKLEQRKEPVMASAKTEPEYVYHATHLGKLESIAAHGLLPSGGSQFNGGYTGHSQGRVFFTAWEGVSFWLTKMEDIANHNSDFTDEEDFDWIPVVIRAPWEAFQADPQHDALGHKDSGGQGSWFVTEKLDPDWIEVWDGQDWTPVEDVDTDSLRTLAIQSSTLEHDPLDVENEEEHPYWNPNFEALHPANPH